MKLHRIEQKSRPYALYAFLWAVLLAAVTVIPIVIYDKGYFLYYGDFNVQEIPFYRLAHDNILNGQAGWDHLTDLGTNFIGSYSFYLLGSPFFWLTMVLPSAWVPYSIAPLLVLKLGFCSLSAYIYLRRYVKDPRYAVIGGILYAFSSFSVYNIFFFHFHEPMIVFPLLLAALDEFHSSGRKGVVALAVCACAVVNYYFFVGQVVFTIVYYIIKLSCGAYRFRVKRFLTMAAECIIGFLMSFFILLPAISAITGNYRITELISGWNMLLYSRSQRYMQIFISMFFPGDIPARNNFTPSANGKWSSVAAYIPMFSMTYVIAYLRAGKGRFFGRMIIILLIMAFLPFLNSAFQLFNATYYARWFYMLTLVFAAVTVRSLDRIEEIEFKKGFVPTLVITLACALLIGLLPEKIKEDGEAERINIGLEKNPTVFWCFCAIAVGGLILTAMLILIYRKKPKLFLRLTAISLSIFVVGYAEFYIWIGKSITDKSDNFMLNYAMNYGEDVTLSDLRSVRSDFYGACDNIGMYWETPTIQAFHSIVPGSVMEFYNKSGVKRDVGSRPKTDFYGLRSLLSVKYLFAAVDSDYKTEKSVQMPGFVYLRTENGFDIYENTAYIPMGFTYDRFITEEEYTDLNDRSKHLALLKAMVLTQEQMKKYADITGYKDGMYDALNKAYNKNKPQNLSKPSYEGFDTIISDFYYGKDDYFEDAAERKASSCSSFTYTKDGFEAEFTNDGNDNLLFFSVPYDRGWTATVNGEPAEIEKVNIGFTAVRVKGGEKSKIVFTYRTPLLKEGVIISACALAAFIIYMIINRGFSAKRKPRKVYRIYSKNTQNTRRQL